MWEDDETVDTFTEIERNVEATFSRLSQAFFDIDRKSLRPLHRIELREDQVTVIFDLPYVAGNEDLTITVTENSVHLEAKLRKSVFESCSDASGAKPEANPRSIYSESIVDNRNQASGLREKRGFPLGKKPVQLQSSL